MMVEIMVEFLDGRDRYYAGEIRSVLPSQAEQFIADGLAKPIGGTAAPLPEGDVTLVIHSSVMGQGAKHHG